MKNFRHYGLFGTLLTAAALSGCGAGGGGGGTTTTNEDVTPPTVSSYSFSNSEFAPADVTSIFLRFSEDVDASTVSATTVTLKDSANLEIPLTISPSFNTTESFFGFTLSSALPTDSEYTFTVSKTVADAAGNTMVNDYSHTFRTAWTRQRGTTAFDKVTNVAVDTDGNFYLAGSTRGGMDGNSNVSTTCTVDGVPLTCRDLYVTKLASDGSLVWTRQLGTTGTDIAEGLAVYDDGAGNVSVYVTGATDGALDGETANGGYDLFLIKYDGSGTKLWTRLLGSSAFEQGTAVAVDSSDNIYVSGITEGDIDGAGAGALAGNSDAFVAKYDTSGNQQWVKQFGTAQNDFAYDLAVDGSNVYLVGDTYDALNGQANAGAYDAFLMKYDTTTGTYQWTKLLGTTGDDTAYDVSADGAGSVYITGSTQGDLDGNTNAGGTCQASNVGVPCGDIFVSKFDSAGTRSWTTLLGAVSDEVAYGVEADSTGIYLAGVGGNDLDGESNSGGFDMVVAKYDSAGAKQWVKLRGSSDGEDDLAIDLVVNTSGVFVVGNTKGDMDDNDNAGDYDLFVVKYAQDGTAR